MSVEVIEFCLCKRNWSRIFEIHGTLESNAINALTALWNAIIFAVEYLEVDLITAVLLEGPFNNTPRTTTVMIQHPFHVFEDEDLRLALDNHTCEFTEQSTASIFKAAALASHRECLARGASDEQVHLALEWFRIKGCDVIVPVGFVKRVVCQISPFTVRVNISGELKLNVQSKPMESMFYGTNPTEGSGEPDCPSGEGERPRQPIGGIGVNVCFGILDFAILVLHYSIPYFVMSSCLRMAIRTSTTMLLPAS